MSVTLIQEKLLSYNCQTILEQENALKEIAQEIALMALAKADFFRIAAFQGGTCLRILYGLERFSEDLDFVLETPDAKFIWESYLKNMQEEFNAYGYQLEIKEKKKLDAAIRSAFLKADSQGGILILEDLKTHKAKIKIKLEIDTNPPDGSKFELKYLDFPLAYSIRTQDQPSLFAGKAHALLTRPYTKGRDWYDFLWYIARKTPINFSLLGSALEQTQNIEKSIITPTWFFENLKTKINAIDWDDTKQDVARFLRPRELPTLQLWSKDFFLSKAEKLMDYLR